MLKKGINSILISAVRFRRTLGAIPLSTRAKTQLKLFLFNLIPLKSFCCDQNLKLFYGVILLLNSDCAVSVRSHDAFGGLEVIALPLPNLNRGDVMPRLLLQKLYHSLIQGCFSNSNTTDDLSKARSVSPVERSRLCLKMTRRH